MDADIWNGRYRAARTEAGAGLWSGKPHGRLQQIVGELVPGTALDLATGDGRNAVWLAQRGWTTTAVDFSTEGLDLARERAGQAGVSVDWQLGDATDWEPAGRFDLVTITYLHLAAEANAAVLRRAARWLNPGGHLLVIGHDRDNVEYGSGGPSDTAILYTAEMLRDAAAGLQILDAKQVLRNTDEDPEGPGERRRIAVDTLLLARNAE